MCRWSTITNFQISIFVKQLPKYSVAGSYGNKKIHSDFLTTEYFIKFARNQKNKHSFYEPVPNYPFIKYFLQKMNNYITFISCSVCISKRNFEIKKLKMKPLFFFFQINALVSLGPRAISYSCHISESIGRRALF